MNPINIRSYSAHEVVILMRRTVDYNKRQNRAKKPRKIMRPARDTWF
nr:MAG TPA: hypothetical protein [Caudoviricetes sp.]